LPIRIFRLFRLVKIRHATPKFVVGKRVMRTA
jgi:hypothetical protein